MNFDATPDQVGDALAKLNREQLFECAERVGCANARAAWSTQTDDEIRTMLLNRYLATDAFGPGVRIAYKTFLGLKSAAEYGRLAAEQSIPLTEKANRIAKAANVTASIANDIASEALRVSKHKRTFVVAVIAAVCAFTSAIFAALAYFKSP